MARHYCLVKQQPASDPRLDSIVLPKIKLATGLKPVVKEPVCRFELQFELQAGRERPKIKPDAPVSSIERPTRREPEVNGTAKSESGSLDIAPGKLSGGLCKAELRFRTPGSGLGKTRMGSADNRRAKGSHNEEGTHPEVE